MELVLTGGNWGLQLPFLHILGPFANITFFFNPLQLSESTQSAEIAADIVILYEKDHLMFILGQVKTPYGFLFLYFCLVLIALWTICFELIVGFSYSNSLFLINQICPYKETKPFWAQKICFTWKWFVYVFSP